MGAAGEGKAECKTRKLAQFMLELCSLRHLCTKLPSNAHTRSCAAGCVQANMSLDSVSSFNSLFKSSGI